MLGVQWGLHHACPVQCWCLFWLALATCHIYVISAYLRPCLIICNIIYAAQSASSFHRKKPVSHHGKRKRKDNNVHSIRRASESRPMHTLCLVIQVPSAPYFFSMHHDKTSNTIWSLVGWMCPQRLRLCPIHNNISALVVISNSSCSILISVQQLVVSSTSSVSVVAAIVIILKDKK